MPAYDWAVQRAPFADLNDDALIALIQRLDDADTEDAELHDALAELYRRLKTQADLDELPAIRAFIGRLKQAFDEDDDFGATGVREPRRQPPDTGGDVIGLAA